MTWRCFPGQNQPHGGDPQEVLLINVLSEVWAGPFSVEWMFLVLVLVQEALTVLKPVSRSGLTQKHQRSSKCLQI